LAQIDPGEQVFLGELFPPSIPLDGMFRYIATTIITTTKKPERNGIERKLKGVFFLLLFAILNY
jgi:hypothetical protein